MKPYPFIQGNSIRLKTLIIQALLTQSPMDSKQLKEYVNPKSKHGSTTTGINSIVLHCSLFVKAQKKTTTETHTGGRYEIFKWQLSDEFWRLYNNYKGRKGPGPDRFEDNGDYPFKTESPTRRGFVYRMMKKD